jgi:hypothetical protein
MPEEEDLYNELDEAVLTGAMLQRGFLTLD